MHDAFFLAIWFVCLCAELLIAHACQNNLQRLTNIICTNTVLQWHKIAHVQALVLAVQCILRGNTHERCAAVLLEALPLH
jgi:hypothetical protein